MFKNTSKDSAAKGKTQKLYHQILREVGVAWGGANVSTSLESAMLQSAWRERRASMNLYSDSRNKKLSRQVTRLLRILEEKTYMYKHDHPLPEGT